MTHDDVKRYKPEKPGRGGWTDWIAPRMKGYGIACCDCGLVHDFQFQVIKPFKKQKRGITAGKLLKGQRVLIRARRNEKDTEIMRREKP